mmetsp:Transcript_23256/g.62880  ORF Transcript_23256/g.62880 Transcript_23256/m.62880 type:complete len:98 (+) Transcript_23256:87-380(+)
MGPFAPLAEGRLREAVVEVLLVVVEEMDEGGSLLPDYQAFAFDLEEDLVHIVAHSRNFQLPGLLAAGPDNMEPVLVANDLVSQRLHCAASLNLGSTC